jgi:hypothetical protein
VIESNQGSSLLNTQLQARLGHLEAPKRERLRAGKTAFELHGVPGANQEAQSRRLGGGREVVIGNMSPGVRVGQGPRRLIADPGTRIRGEKVTCWLGSEEEEEAHPPSHTAEDRGPRGQSDQTGISVQLEGSLVSPGLPERAE